VTLSQAFSQSQLSTASDSFHYEASFNAGMGFICSALSALAFVVVLLEVPETKHMAGLRVILPIVRGEHGYMEILISFGKVHFQLKKKRKEKKKKSGGRENISRSMVDLMFDIKVYG
jgi:hypothetical protein